VYLLVFYAYINEMHGSRSKIPSKKSRPYIYIYDVKFLTLLGATNIYDISGLRVKLVFRDWWSSVGRVRPGAECGPYQKNSHGISGGVMTFAAICSFPLELRVHAEGKILRHRKERVCAVSFCFG
jgi:hypothetical protein